MREPLVPFPGSHMKNNTSGPWSSLFYSEEDCQKMSLSKALGQKGMWEGLGVLEEQ